ncbi:MAG: SH3 domain-containing protein [Anaerolineae bacterium]|nr:SH3 domain-containing protein [Anaerolineae bacterium]
MTRRLLLLTLIFTMLLAVAAPAFAQSPVASVSTGSLNVRSGPGLQYGSVATLPYGFGVQMVARNDAGNWIYISLTNGVTGWVNVNYLYTNYPTRSLPVGEQLIAAPLVPTGANTGAISLNLRTNPDPVAAIVRVVGLSQTFELIGRSYDSNWAQIRLPDGTVGWVEARYVTTGVPVRSVSPSDGSVYAPPPPPYGSTGQPTYARRHLVVAGDTLAKIAQRYGVNLYAIAAANNITNVNLIYRGTYLIIP